MFRPCIDLHDGQVKQIVGGTLGTTALVENYVSSHDAAYYAALYKQHSLFGGHIVLLGAGNEAQATAALREFPGGMMVGGGVNPSNAMAWIERGASHVVVTSYVFTNKQIDYAKLAEITGVLGGPHRLVLDLSCRKRGNSWFVATDRWQTITDTEITRENLEKLAEYCAEFLVHAADVEGLQRGMDRELIEFLAVHSPVPVTYAGGATSVADVAFCGDVFCTVGSALDIFGGSKCTFAELVAYNATRATEPVSVVNAYYRAMAAHSVDACLVHLDDNVEVCFGAETHRNWRGIAAAREKFGGMFVANPGFAVRPPRVFRREKLDNRTVLHVDAFFDHSNTRRVMIYEIAHDTGKIVRIGHGEHLPVVDKK